VRIAGLLVLPLAVLLAGSLAGQTSARWTWSVYPTGVNLSGNTGPQIGVGFGSSRRADSLARHLLDASFTAAGGYGWRGSWFGSLEFRAPGLWPGWRVVLTGLAQREARFEFLGLGNESVYDPDLVNDTQPYFYKLRRTRYRAAVEGSRAIASGYSVALAVGVAHTRFDALPGPSRFLTTQGRAVVEPDRTARLSLVFDRRTNEYDPRRGLFLELSATVGSGGGGYTRFTSVTRAYLSLGPRTSAALKLAAARAVGRPPLSASFEFPMWGGSIDVLGGPVSHRGLRSQRFVGRDVEFGTVEVRRSVFRWGSRVEILGAAFVDFGRVFEGASFVPTVKHLKLGPGLGLGVRFKGKSLVHVYAAHGPDGIVVTSRTGWVF
jgi:surface antigen Omp85-like protein